MKTFKKEIEKPRLVIKYCNSESPRTWSNIGYFITVSNKMLSPDNNKEIISIVKNTQYEVNNVFEHMDAIKEEIKNQLNEEVIYITPLCKYEHNRISYLVGTKTGFDYSNNGFYIVTKESANEILGNNYNEENIVNIIQSEIETYNQWVNGEVYEYILYNENGNVEDSCCGFYSLEEIKGCLPKDFDDEDMEDYLIG